MLIRGGEFLDQEVHSSFVGLNPKSEGPGELVRSQPALCSKSAVLVVLSRSVNQSL